MEETPTFFVQHTGEKGREEERGKKVKGERKEMVNRSLLCVGVCEQMLEG